MYSCVPAKRARQRLVEGVGQDLLWRAPGRRAARRSRRTSASCPASSRRAPPPVGVRCRNRPRGVVQLVKPIDWASRRAGSIVRTHTRRPRSAARSASAAAVVVLPTPPEPQQTMIRVAGSSSMPSTSRRRGRVRRLAADQSWRWPVAELVGELVQAAEVDCRRRASRARRSADRCTGVVAALRARVERVRRARRPRSSSASTSAVCAGSPAALTPASISARRARPCAAARSVAPRSSRRADLLTMTRRPAGRQPAARHPVERLLDRHLLEQRDQVDGGPG